MKFGIMDAVIDLHTYLDTDSNRYKHSVGVYNRMCIVLRNLPESFEVSEMALISAILHDIGYSNQLSVEGYHPYDGYRFLLNKGYSPRIAEVVLFHSYAKELSITQSTKIKDLHNTIQLNPTQTRVLQLLNYCDFLTSPSGKEVSFESRLEEIKNRLGEESLPYKVLFRYKSEITKSLSSVYNSMSKHPLFFT